MRFANLCILFLCTFYISKHKIVIDNLVLFKQGKLVCFLRNYNFLTSFVPKCVNKKSLHWLTIMLFGFERHSGGLESNDVSKVGFVG